MLVVVTTVSALVHLYASATWPRRTRHASTARFFAYLSFFTFAMLALVTADNLLQLFFGWEGVGVASYLLIGFYYRKPSAGAAAIKAFIVNRVGDFGFLLGIFALYVLVGSIGFDTDLRRGEIAPRQTIHFLGGTATRPGGLAAAVHRRHGQVGAAVPAHLAAGRHGGPDAGVGADPCRDHGDGRRVPGLPHVAGAGVVAHDAHLHHLHRRRRPRSSRRRSGWCRTTSSG